MSLLTKEDLKEKFQGGDVPTQSDYEDLIDSQVNISEDLDSTPFVNISTVVTSQYFKRLADSQCIIWLSSDQTITTATLTTVQFDTVTYDPLNKYDNTTNWDYEVTYAGSYDINFMTRFLSVSDQIAFNIHVAINGVTVRQFNGVASASSPPNSASIGDLFRLSAEDKVTARVFHTEGSDIDISGSEIYTRMSIAARSLD